MSVSIRRLRALARVISHIAPSLCLLALMSYFAWSAFQGDYGWFAYSHASSRVEALTIEIAIHEREAEALRAQVNGLTEPDIDLDLLDERLRANLGYLRPDEVLLTDR